MRDYGKVHTSFWSSDDMRHLSDDAKMLALYLLTGQHTNMIGCFRLPDGYITEDVNWPFERVSKGLDELSKEGFITRNSRTKWVFITNFMRWNTIDNVNQAVSALKLFEKIPNDFEAKPDAARVFLELMSSISEHKNAEKIKGWETVVKPFADPSLTSSSNRISNSKQEQKKTPSLCENEKKEIPGPNHNAILGNRAPPAGGSSQLGKFQMFSDWMPESDFVQKSALWGKPIGKGYSSAELMQFVDYWIAEGKVFHQAQWEQKLAQSISVSRSKASKPTKGDQHETSGRSGSGSDYKGRAAEAVSAATARLRQQEGIDEEGDYLLGEHGSSVYGQMDEQERGGPVITLDSSDWQTHQ